MKRILSLFFTLILGISMIASLASVSADTVVSISTVQQLAAIRDDLDGNYKLTKNLKFSKSDFEKGGAFYNDGAGWLPIGSSPTKAFTGTFDGNGYTISGLYIKIVKAKTDSTAQYAGLFGNISGTVKDLCLDNVDITVEGSEAVRAGAVAGFSKGKIEQVSATGKITCKNGGNTTAVGGIVGRQTQTASVTECRTGINLMADGVAVYLGGMVGQNMGGVVSASKSAGILNGDADYHLYIGGMVGLNDNSTSTNGIVVDCLRDGETVGWAESVVYGGGLVGQNKGRISSCVVLQEARFDCASHVYAGQVAGQNAGVIGLTYYINETGAFPDIGTGTTGETTRLEPSFSKDDVKGLLQDSEYWSYSGGTVKLNGLPALPTTTKPSTTTENKVTLPPTTTTKKPTTTKQDGSSKTTTAGGAADGSANATTAPTTGPTLPAGNDFVEDSDDFGSDDTTDEERQDQNSGWVVWLIIGICAVVVLASGTWLIIEFKKRQGK